jgi:hypothetical protein
VKPVIRIGSERKKKKKTTNHKTRGDLLAVARNPRPTNVTIEKFLNHRESKTGTRN